MNINDVSYIGIFLPHINGNLEKDIPQQHITLSYRPDIEKFKELLPNLGKLVKVSVLGYGNDEKNEGLLVDISQDIPYYGAENKHITLSISKDSSAVKTGYISFDASIPTDIANQIEQPLIGKIAVFTKDKTLIFNPNEFEEYGHFHSELSDDVLGDYPSMPNISYDENSKIITHNDEPTW